MRIPKQVAAAAAMLTLGGFASQMGTIAGDVVGDTAWVAGKAGALALKGGTVAVKATGRAAAGAVQGVHEKFTSDKSQAPAQTANASSGSRTSSSAGSMAGAPSPTEGADLANRVKDADVGSLSQRQGASLAD